MTAMLDRAGVRDVDWQAAAPWAEAWHRWISVAFLRSYLDACTGAPFLPAADDLPLVLDIHLIEKAFQELRDEIATPGETVAIPLAALIELLGV